MNAVKSDQRARVLDRLAQWLELRGRDWKTVRSYCRTAGHFYDFSLSCPREWSSEKKAEAFLTKRVRVDDVAAATQNHDLNALNALYASRGQKLGNVDALRAKRPVHERHAPTTAEYRALLDTLNDTPSHPMRFVALWLGSMGLRVDEGLSVRLKDIRPREGRVSIVLRDPKHGHDRLAPVPPELLPQLRRQFAYARRVFMLDQTINPPLPLQVPHAIARKYRRSPHTQNWAFLFPSPRPMRHPKTKSFVRWHLPANIVQNAFARACDALETCGSIGARITPHHLRHWFGTYFQGDIRDLQALLGHKSLETTQTYRHPQIERTVSPISAVLAA